jgi:hypothetical protein
MKRTYLTPSMTVVKLKIGPARLAPSGEENEK